MPLSAGEKLGAYEIISPLGAGGMGEVYRALDNKLGREVAIKVLPEEFTEHPQKLARFEREARLLAALNHPGIATLHGLEKSKGKPFLVMELVEGQTLADRISLGAVPVGEALEVSRQIAEALEAAHEKGVIHRDLKPANIKVDPEGHVKVLDFGLAKAFADEVPESELSQSPTLSRDATRAGVILGTAAYMSPEQAKGKAVDKRSDIFSFGAVLYELLTGKKAFGGEDVSDVLASIIKLDIDWKALPSDLDPRIRKLLGRCLKQDRKKRLRDIGDVRNEIEEILTQPMEPAQRDQAIQPVSQSKWPWLAAIAVTALIAAGAVWFAMRPAVPPVIRSTLVHPGTEFVGHPFESPVAISPDGLRIAYIVHSGASTGIGRLYVRRLDELEPTLLAEAARAPFFSPDSQWVGFRASGAGPLLRVAVTGGPAVPIGGGEADGGSRGATWGPDDTIVFATNNTSTGLSKISAAGGEVEALTTPDSKHGESDHVFPEFLPDGRAVLFTITKGQETSNSQIAVLDLDTREYRVLIQGGSDARYTASGHIVYGVAGTLRAVPFDLGSLEVHGTPTPVVSGVVTQQSGAAAFSVSPDGTLVYVAGSEMSALRTPVWIDREGREEVIPAEPRGYEYVHIAHDGQRVAFDECNTGGYIWVWNFTGGNASRLTTEPTCYPIWTADDGRIAFSRGIGSGLDNSVVLQKASNNTGSVEPLTPSMGSGNQGVTPYFFSAEDRLLVFREQAHPETLDNIGMISLDEGAEPEWLLASEFNERNAALSPDERFMAYQSDESGQYEVYVRPFPNVNDDLWVISTAGGLKPLWSRDGRELFYIEPGTPMRLMSVPVRTGSAFEHQSPQEIMEWPYDWRDEGRAYDVSLDGKRFLTVKPVDTGDDTPPPQINIVTNWFEELKRLVPTD